MGCRMMEGIAVLGERQDFWGRDGYNNERRDSEFNWKNEMVEG